MNAIRMFLLACVFALTGCAAVPQGPASAAASPGGPTEVLWP